MAETEGCHSVYTEQMFTISENDIAHSMKRGECMENENGLPKRRARIQALEKLQAGLAERIDADLEKTARKLTAQPEA